MYDYDLPFELRYDEAGCHAHYLLRPAKATASDGSHSHIWYVNQRLVVSGCAIQARSVLSSYYDGAHVHALGETRTTDKGSAHRHGVTLDYQRMTVLVTETDGEHTHELLVKRTVSDGVHAHALSLGDTKLMSMLPTDLLALIESMKSVERDAQAGTIVASGDHVLVEGQVVCKHDSSADAEKCVAARRVFAGVGFVAKMHEGNFHGLHWLARGAAEVANAKKPALPGRLLSSMERLVSEK